MAKQYGLITPNKEKKIIQRPSIFNSDSDSDEPTPIGIKKTHKKKDQLAQHKAIEEDPTVYQYDEVYDEIDKKRKESLENKRNVDRKPKYINKLLAAADRRKKENERRIERQVQRERETEGNEFQDKDSYVTSSYKKKLEEMKEMEEQEKREAYLEAIGDVTKQGNLDGFYRHLYDQKVNYDETETKVDAERVEIKQESTESEEKTESRSADVKKRRYRKHSKSSSEQSEDDVTIKKEHIPSNLDADSDFSIDSSDSEEENEKTQNATTGEDKLEIATKESESEEKAESKEAKETDNSVKIEAEVPKKKPKIDIWKKRTVGDVFDAALQRYYERKALRDL